MLTLVNKLQGWLDAAKHLDFLAPLALRLYLVPVFWYAGMNKLADFNNVVEWFGNPDWGLGLPMPWLMAFLATATELAGAVLLLIGFGVRWVSIPLMITMLVAVFTVHIENGWQAVADKMSPFAPDDIDAAMEKLDRAKSILQEHGHYDWLTSSGNFVISNNGIEWAVTYFIMLLALFFMGAGKYLGIDFWLARKFSTAD
jgi:uncharacterized membrane protein YphA (DoxX/SURF4 family)